MAFYSMQHQHAQPPAPTAPTSRPDTTPIDPSLRKRPLYSAERPLAPRAIQPRPPASTASYSSESSAQLSPRLETAAGEPPRKRGRPSKAETERRKAAAEARGETYPLPRRSGSARLKVPTSPTSSVAGAATTAYQPSNTPKPAQSHGQSSMQYEMGTNRSIASMASLPGTDERRDIPTRSMGPNMRELPRPQELNHPLPSPHALQLGPPDSFPRLNNHPSERGPYAAIPPDRFSPSDSGRRDSATSRGEQPPPPGQYERGTSTTPNEKAIR